MRKKNYFISDGKTKIFTVAPSLQKYLYVYSKQMKIKPFRMVNILKIGVNKWNEIIVQIEKNAKKMMNLIFYIATFCASHRIWHIETFE